MTSWFRSWHGAPTDNKWLVIAAKAKVKPGIVSAVAWALFDHASQTDDRGSVKDFDTETYAVFSGFDEAQVAAVIDAMKTKGVIDQDGRLANWDKRQPKREDDSTERVRKWRKEKNSAGSNGNGNSDDESNAPKRSVTHGNNTDTEQIQNRTEKGGATAPEPHPPSNNYFGMKTPIRKQHVIADGYTQDAAKLGVDAKTYVAIFNALIDEAGWRALVDAGSDTELNYAKADALKLISMGNTTVEHVKTLATAYRKAYHWKGAPTPKNLAEYASQLQQGVAPTGDKPKVTAADEEKQRADLRAAKSRISTAQKLGMQPQARDEAIVARYQSVGAH